MRKSLVSMLLLSAGTLITNNAGAQTVKQSSAETPASDQDIIVTAQRRAQRLEEVPMAVTAVSGDALAKAGIVSIHDINQVAAGASVGFGGGYTAPAIRGVTTSTQSNGTDNNVAIYFDGFYEPSPIVISQDIVNLSSVEVLKGPQGTLYGRNATGGAILFNTMAPSETFTGKLEATYARFDDKRISGYVSAPLSSSIRFSLAGYYRKTDGYLHLIPNPAVPGSGGHTAGLDQRSIRAKVAADILPELDATLSYNYGYSNDPRSNLYTPVANRSALFPANDPLTGSKFGEQSYNYDVLNSAHYNQGTLALVYHPAFGDITSRTGYEVSLARNHLDADGSYRDFTSTQIGFRQKTFQQSLDFDVKTISRLDLLFGGLYIRDQLDSDPATATSNYGANRVLLQRTDAHALINAFGVYADATYHLTDSLSINAGARYNYEKHDISIITVNGTGGILYPLTNRSVTFKKVTPRASIRYEIAPRTNIYASWSRGFRPGTFNLSPPSTVSTYGATKSETITAYEVGFKTASSMFHFDVSGFYYDYRDLIVSTTVPNPTCSTCGFVSLFGNAPKAEIYGIDGQVSVTPATGLTLKAGASWLHARYKDFTNATGTVLTAAGTNQGGVTQDWSGQQMTRSPNFTGNAAVLYETELARGKLNLSANANYSASYVISNASLYGAAAGPALANVQRFRQDNTFILNAQIGWTEPSGHFTVTAFGNNLTNQFYLLSFNGGSFGTYGSKAEPISYGVRGTFNW